MPPILDTERRQIRAQENAARNHLYPASTRVDVTPRTTNDAPATANGEGINTTHREDTR